MSVGGILPKDERGSAALAKRMLAEADKQKKQLLKQIEDLLYENAQLQDKTAMASKAKKLEKQLITLGTRYKEARKVAEAKLAVAEECAAAKKELEMVREKNRLLNQVLGQRPQQRIQELEKELREVKLWRDEDSNRMTEMELQIENDKKNPELLLLRETRNTLMQKIEQLSKELQKKGKK